MSWKLKTPAQLYMWIDASPVDPTHHEYSFNLSRPTFRCPYCDAILHVKGGISVILSTDDMLREFNLIDIMSVRTLVDSAHPLKRYFEWAATKSERQCQCAFALCRIGKEVQKKNGTALSGSRYQSNRGRRRYMI